MQMYTNITNEKKNKHFFFPWYCDYAERQPFDEIKHRHTLKEVGDVAEGRYDWKIERGARWSHPFINIGKDECVTDFFAGLHGLDNTGKLIFGNDAFEHRTM